MQVLCVTELSTPCERQIQKGRACGVGDAFTRCPHAGSRGRGPRLEALLSVAHVVPQTWIRKKSDEGRVVSQTRFVHVRRVGQFVAGSKHCHSHTVGASAQGRFFGPQAAALCLKVQQEEVTRARQCLTGAALAPGTEDTLREMQSRRPQQVQRPIPRQVLEFQPDSPVEVDRNTFVKSLKSAPKGSSPGLGGCTYEHLRVLMDDAGIFDLFFEAVSSLSQARIPAEVGAALMGARLTALAKPDGGVRGIATGLFIAETCRQNSCGTVCSRVRKGMRTIPIRSVDKGWDRLRRAHAPSCNGCRPSSHQSQR